MTRKRPPQRAGLEALLGQSSELAKAPARATQTLAVSDLTAGKGQPRREFNEAALEELATSIREKGILQPLLVRPVAGGHEIVAGERRWRAAQLAGLTEVPVVVREMDDHEARQLALIENLQREDLNTVDEVDAKLDLVAATLDLSREAARTRLMQLLRESPGDDHAALELAFGSLGEQWQSFTRNKLKILKWPEPVLNAVRAGLSYRVAQVVVGAPEQQHTHLLELALSGGSSSEVQAEIRRLAARPPERPQAVRVARVLGSARWLSGLDPKQQKAVEAWLAKMPDAVREALEN